MFTVKQMKRFVFEWISNEIDMAEKYGIPVHVQGVRYTSDESEKLYAVLENAVYMDESGRITQINFDKVDKF